MPEPASEPVDAKTVASSRVAIGGCVTEGPHTSLLKHLTGVISCSSLDYKDSLPGTPNILGGAIGSLSGDGLRLPAHDTQGGHSHRWFLVSALDTQCHLHCVGQSSTNTCVNDNPVNWYNNDSHTQLGKISSLPAYKYV